MQQFKTDILVIGSGIAGLSFALKIADFAHVTIITKDKIDQANTKYAQGGIAAVLYPPDNFEQHIKDTITAGDGLNNPEIVKMVVSQAPDRIKDLINWGVEFDKLQNGKFELGREGGHSLHRILHHKDSTGLEIEQKLVNRVKNHPNIQILEYHFAIDIITQHHLGYPVAYCQDNIYAFGAYVLDLKNNVIKTFISKITYIATGGIGNIYQTTTNPSTATGDGIAMAYRAKAKIENMEFVQFHPTALYNPKERPAFLITEALRGFGAKLKNLNGEEFMQKYDPRGNLAPRDIVARAIDSEMKKHGHDYVLLDASHLPKNNLIKHFPHIYEKCKQIGINITSEPIPVVPAAHYLCGGIKVDKFGRTTIHNLFAGGEVASTGLHGANRLASNSLLEALVFAHNSAQFIKQNINNIQFQDNIPDWDDKGTKLIEEMILISQEFRELQQIMSNYVGIVRTNLRLHRALSRLEILYKETEELYNKSKINKNICELRNSINVAYLIIKMALRRKESRGLHYNLDYPFKLPINKFLT